MTYYLMLERDNDRSPWRAEFGSTDRTDVDFEVDDRRDHDVKKKNLRVVSFGRVPSQAAVDARVAEINGFAPPSLPVATRRIEVTP